MIGKEEILAVNRVMNTGRLSEYKGNWSSDFYGGYEIRELEKEYANFVGVKHAIACNSATSGLYASLASLELTDGSEVLVTPYSMTCSASLPILFNAKPVFVDIEDQYFCIDPDKVEEKITEKTKAIIVVNLFGHPYEADKINAIAKKHNIHVIEDSAQAPMSTYKGRMSGSLGDLGVFSFNYHKHIHCGEGGMITTNDDKLAFKCRLIVNHAEAVVNSMEDGMPYVNLIGMNLRMTELQACIVREQLKKLPEYVNRYQKWGELLGIKVSDYCTHSFYRYAFLNKDNIPLEDLCPSQNLFHIKKHYITPIYKMPYFKNNGYSDISLPVVEEVEKNIVLLWFREKVLE